MKTKKKTWATIPQKSDKIDLIKLSEHLESLDLTNRDNLNFWLYCKIAMKTGLRYSDVSGLRVKNYNPDKKEFIIIEKKTNKKSVIPFDFPQIVMHFNTGAPDDFIIFNKTYSTVISLMTVNRRLKALYGGSLNVSSHSIRKATASVIYNRTDKDIFATMKFLNHSSIEMTRKYLNLDEEDKNWVFRLLD